MAGVWDKLDAYTKSDYLDSSDEDVDIQEVILSNKNCCQNEECSVGDVEVKQGGGLLKNLMNEMRESKLHCDTESRNIQEKIDDISAEKKRMKEEPSEMHHKAQVISKSARMSATEVLSTIINSETMNIEENSQMGEYLNKIRSVQTESGSSEQPDTLEEDCGPKSLSSHIDLPDIPPLSTTVLNTGLLKSRANVARQGSMKARRKPTHRKSWTPGIDELNLQEQGQTDKTGVSDFWVLPQGDAASTATALHRTGSCTPSDSSSEDEKEVAKPLFRSGIALPGLADIEKIKTQRSELKRPTALNIVKSAKDAKENEVTKEDKTEVVVQKPDWMKEVEQRKKTPKPARRKYRTLPGRCSELDKLFEQRKNEKDLNGADVDEGLQDDGAIAKEFRPHSRHDGDIDPQLNKLLEKRRNLKAMEGVTTDVEPTVPRPKSLHLEQPSELDNIFEKRKNLRPVEGIVTEGSQVPIQGPATAASPRPRSFHSDGRSEAGIVRARLHDGHAKLEPLTFTGQVKVAAISEVHSGVGHQVRPGQATQPQVGQVIQFTHDAKDGSRAMVGRIPPSNQGTSVHVTTGQSHSGQVTQAGHVAQFAFDGKGGNHAMIGRIPPAGNQRPPARLGQNIEHRVTPVVAKYEDQPHKDQQIRQSRSNHLDSYESPLAAGRSFNQEMVSSDDRTINRGPVSQTFSPQRSATQGIVGYPSVDRQSNQWMPNANKSPSMTPDSSISDTHSFVEQLSVNPGYQEIKGKSKSNHRVRSWDNSIEYESVESVGHTRHAYSKQYSDDGRFNSPNTSSHVGLRLPPNTPTPPPHPKSQLPKPHRPDHTLPPLHITQGHPQPGIKSPGTNAPKTNYSQRVGNSQKSTKGNYAQPVRLRMVTSPVESPISNNSGKSDPFVPIENTQLDNRSFENGFNRVKSPVGYYSSAGPDPNLKRQNIKHSKPVTVTVKSISESPVQVQVRENGISGGRDEALLSMVTNGDVSKRSGEMRRVSLLNGSLDPQSSQSTTPELPKWKQELRDKKRLQGERPRKTIHDKENIKAESSEGNIAEWQKRLKGIRRIWGEKDDTVKDSNDNFKEAITSAGDNEKDIPGFLKEFKKIKQKVKVTVTAKSTPSDTERTTVNEDRKSSSKHELGTYV